MRTLITALAVATMALSGMAAAAPSVGAPAPEFAGIDSNGRTVKLTDFRGKTVVLEWTNHGCPYVVKHYDGGNMQALQNEAKAKGVVWLSVISSAPGKQGAVTPAEANALTASRNASPTHVVLDPAGAIGRAFEAKTTPHMFVIDKMGIVRYMGAIDDKPSTAPSSLAVAVPWARTAMADVVAGRTPSPAETEPYGCSVKY